MTRKLTADDYDKIPCPGSGTFKVPDTRTLMNSQSYAYTLALRRNERIEVSTDRDKCTITITKVSRR